MYIQLIYAGRAVCSLSSALPSCSMSHRIVTTSSFLSVSLLLDSLSALSLSLSLSLRLLHYNRHTGLLANGYDEAPKWSFDVSERLPLATNAGAAGGPTTKDVATSLGYEDARAGLSARWLSCGATALVRPPRPAHILGLEEVDYNAPLRVVK